MVLPDFRNLGVILRIVVLAEVVRFAFAFAEAGDLPRSLELVIDGSPYFEPILLLNVLALFAFSPLLSAKAYRPGTLLVLLVVALSSLAGYTLQWVLLAGVGRPSLFYLIFISLSIAALQLWYFNWRYRVLSPALPEARLIALQARIRPHFLFNSLNTVLGLIRTEPRQAERVLEGLAELYRALLTEPGNLVRLDRELALARSYAEVECVRLGSRVAFNWQCQGAPMDALVPPLILQPLIENAVYHGIEPSETGGAVSLTVFLKNQQLHVVVRNPCPPTAGRVGNRIAMTNIRERLALHFDAEAEMSAYHAGGEYVVQIRLPYKHD